MVEIAQIELNRRKWGEGTARVLLLHGLGSSAETWAPIARRLGRASIAPDLRGHGASPRGDSYLVADYVTDVLALGSGWELVVAHSLGGLIAAQAAQDPEWARRLVLIDPALEVEDDVLDAVAEANVREITGEPPATYFRDANPRWSAEDARLKAEAVRQACPDMVERTLADIAPWRYADLLTTLAVPTLVLGADPAHGAIFGRDLGAASAAANPLVEYRQIDGTGHSPHRDDPGAVTAAIDSLLAVSV